ncbi:MAG: hypothetical protein ACYCVH_03650 [Ignavibacteriaceae bacterium]
MKKILIPILLLIAGVIFAQTFKVEKAVGKVKVQIGASESWTSVRIGDMLAANSIITTGEKSSLILSGNNIKFSLKESSALPLTNLKKMSVDDLILALAMQDMINAPRKKEEANSKNTAVYGAEINGVKEPFVVSSNFGVQRLNGAVQLAENGFKESAIVDAKETFRKYPETSKMASFRIYFANLLADLNLNEDAYDDFKQISSLKLDSNQKSEVAGKLDVLSKKLMKN